eukprot:3932647-Rhodomonas_salina.2
MVRVCTSNMPVKQGAVSSSATGAPLAQRRNTHCSRTANPDAEAGADKPEPGREWVWRKRRLSVSHAQAAKTQEDKCSK